MTKDYWVNKWPINQIYLTQKNFQFDIFIMFTED